MTVGLLSGLWVVAIGLQVGDVLTAWLEAVTAQDGRGARAERRRAGVLFWTISVPGMAVLLAAVGVDFAVRLVLAGDAVAGFVILVLVALAVTGVSAAAVVAIGGPGARTYASLRDELREQLGNRPERDRVQGWRDELASIDDRHRRLSRKGRPGWRTWRLLPPLIGVANTSAAVALVVLQPEPVTGGILTVSVLVLAGSVLLTVAAERFAARSRIAWGRIYVAQRAEIVAMLEELERKAVRRIPGLGERVARALTILREQQR